MTFLDTRMGYATPDEGLVGSTTSKKGRGRKWFESDDDDTLKVRCERRRNILNNDRLTWWPNWIDLSDHFRPYRGRWFVNAAVDTNKGWRRNYRIVDSTPLIANNTCAAGMLAGAASPSRPWFAYTLENEELMEAPGVKQWLAQVTKTNREILARSNFYPQLFEGLGEYPVFGLMAIGKEWHAPKDETEPDLPNFHAFTIGSYYIAQDDKRRVNTFFRDFRWTVEQTVRKFATGPLDKDASWEGISLRTRGFWFQGLKDTWIDLVHAVEENNNRQKGTTGQYHMDASGMRFRSVYYERGGDPAKILSDSAKKTEAQKGEDKKLLRVGGFRDFPVLTARWYTNSEDVYGRGPAMDAIGDARALQLQQKRKAQAIDKMVDPPMVAHPNLRNQRTSTLSGDTTFVAPDGNTQVGFQPAYEVKPDVSALLEDIKETQERIKSLMFADIFAMFIQAETTGQPITAAEVNAKQQEKLLMLGPVLEQLNAMFDQLHQWLFAEGMRHGKYPQVPPAMRGTSIRVQYTSILAQAINAVTAGSINEFTKFLGEVAQISANAEQNPHLDKADFDKMIEEQGKAMNVPPPIVRSDADVDQIRKVRQKQQEQAQAQQEAQQQAEMMQQHSQTAKNLSATPVGGGSALDLLAQATGSQQVPGK